MSTRWTDQDYAQELTDRVGDVGCAPTCSAEGTERWLAAVVGNYRSAAIRGFAASEAALRQDALRILQDCPSLSPDEAHACLQEAASLLEVPPFPTVSVRPCALQAYAVASATIGGSIGGVVRAMWQRRLGGESEQGFSWAPFCVWVVAGAVSAYGLHLVGWALARRLKISRLARTLPGELRRHYLTALQMGVSRYRDFIESRVRGAPTRENHDGEC